MEYNERIDNIETELNTAKHLLQVVTDYLSEMDNLAIEYKAEKTTESANALAYVVARNAGTLLSVTNLIADIINKTELNAGNTSSEQ